VDKYTIVHVNDSLALTNRFFVTRERGEQAYQDFMEHLQDIPDNHALILWFPPDQLIDSSFADESVVRLGEELGKGKFGERGLLAAGLTQDSLHNLESALRYQGSKLAIIAIMSDGDWRLVGKLEKSLRDTLELVAKQGKITAPDLARQLNLAVNTASTRLKRLHALHLLWREYEVSPKGLEYTYHFWRWT
jgi:hypothetical protein